MFLPRTVRAAFSLIALLAPLSASAAETYTLDPMHTQVVWSINHFGFSHPSGKFPSITGKLVLDDAVPANSKVNVVIPVGKLVTGLDKLNEHLLGEGFLDAAHFPTATFESTKVERLGKDKAKVTGNLLLHGVTKPVTLDVTLNKLGENPITKKKTAGFSASTVIKRSEFGITSYLPGLGDEVTLSVESEAGLL